MATNVTATAFRGQMLPMALDKKRLKREIERARRERFKARLVELRGLIADARKARDAAILGVRVDCQQKRIELRNTCQARKLSARAQGNQTVAERRAQLAEERSFERKMQRVERPRKQRSTARERAQESDDEVRNNLEPNMVPVFDSVKKYIKGTPRKSRTEAFLQWAEENPGEVFELMQHDADRYLASLLAEQERTEREMRRSKLAGVPF
jgi:hypothetical protein